MYIDVKMCVQKLQDSELHVHVPLAESFECLLNPYV